MTSGQANREELVRSAVKAWTKQLTDLGGRNRLIYFRELKRGTLNLSATREGVSPVAVGQLLRGSKTRLTEIFDPHMMDDVARSVRALKMKEQANFEEKGLSTLYLAHVFATWTEGDGKEPRAPLALHPLDIKSHGVASNDATLTLAGPAEVNTSMLYALNRGFGVAPFLDPELLPDEIEDWIEAARKACAQVPGFSIDRSTYAANLAFTKLEMVQDLESNIAMLLENDLVAAIAGDDGAKSEFITVHDIDMRAPDFISPADEFLILDADASQNHAINAVLAGDSLVVHGPPGTGKSQTIANLIASLAARGKSVLFVAEKRAAIDAVTKRLNAKGCGELVLDLHGGAASRRRFAQQLEKSIDMVASTPLVDNAHDMARLSAARQALRDHMELVHEVREPFGLSVFELQAIAGTAESEQTGIRIAEDALLRWTPEARLQVDEDLRSFHILGQRLDQDPSGLWATSNMSTLEQARWVTEMIGGVAGRDLPMVESALLATRTEIGLAPGPETCSIEEFVSQVSLLQRLHKTYQLAFIEEAEHFADHLVPAQRSAFGRFFQSLFNSSYRLAKSNTQNFAKVKVKPAAALLDARLLLELRAWWDAISGGNEFPAECGSADYLKRAFVQYSAGLDRLVELFPSLRDLDTLERQGAALRDLRQSIHLAPIFVERHGAIERLGALGLNDVVAQFPSGQGDLAALRNDVQRIFAVSAMTHLAWQLPQLARFDGGVHQSLLDEFRTLDEKHVRASSHRVMRRVAERALAEMSARPQEEQIVRRQAGLQRRHMPVRDLVAKAPRLVKALRPCWALSPLVVSQLLPPVPDLFDVVIFDEASQIVPAEAIPSIARARQIVVAGDPHQLPPTQFFTSESAEDEEEIQKSAEAGALTTDFESILDVSRALLPVRMLNWHYRSQDERLINFSNIHIYDRSLVTFPGARSDSSIGHELVTGLPGASSEIASSPHEVRRVVELILAHANERPHESLGVIAMGITHANNIEEALRIERISSVAEANGFFDEALSERFFVKNLERVQGDERDHIILSVGYGKTPAGQVVYRWGPINTEGGQRRLNVAATRAKRRMTVVSSFASIELDPSRTRSRGADLLRLFIKYAERHGDDVPGSDAIPELNAFEISVRDRLAAAGIPLKAQYGAGRFRIDFAAFHPDMRNRPVLAIEADGASYHSTATARDRDRLRQEVLERMGWRFHRIWSTDWFRDPSSGTQRALAAWQRAVQAGPVEKRRPVESAPAPDAVRRGALPIAVGRSSIAEYSDADLAQLVKWIGSDSLLRTDDEIIREAMAVLGFRRHGSRIDQALLLAISRTRRRA